jgi:O-acetyl-ADP-ribose deacetylase (regulator of RNase III)
MGKGLAASLKDRDPDMFKAYKRICDQKLLDIGQLWLWRSTPQWVLNFPTKKHWRRPSSLAYVEAGLKKFVAHFEAKGIREIAFPRLGCGNGGLSPSVAFQAVPARSA